MDGDDAVSAATEDSAGHFAPQRKSLLYCIAYRGIALHIKDQLRVGKQARRVACGADYSSSRIVNGHALVLLCAFHYPCTCPAAPTAPAPAECIVLPKRLTIGPAVLWLLRVDRDENKNKQMLSSAPHLALRLERLKGWR